MDIKTLVNSLVRKYGTRDPFELCDYTNTLYEIVVLHPLQGCYLSF